MCTIDCYKFKYYSEIRTLVTNELYQLSKKLIFLNKFNTTKERFKR